MPTRRARFGLDSNCLIAMVSEWHDQHRRTLSAYEHWLSRGAEPVIAANSILECFSVLTRLPPTNRLPPEIAAQTISEVFFSTAVIVGISRQAAVSAMEDVGRLGLGGGQVYDAAIAHRTVDET